MHPDIRLAAEAAAEFREALRLHPQDQRTQTFSAGVFRGKRVRLVGYARPNKVSEWAGLWMRVDGPQKEPLALPSSSHKIRLTDKLFAKARVERRRIWRLCQFEIILQRIRALRVFGGNRDTPEPAFGFH